MSGRVEKFSEEVNRSTSSTFGPSLSTKDGNKSRDSIGSIVVFVIYLNHLY